MIRRLIFLSIVARLIVLPIPGIAGPDDDKAECSVGSTDRIGACTRRIESKDLSSHDLPDAYTNRGEAYLKLYGEGAAELDFNKAAELDRAPRPPYQIAGIYMLRGMYKEALSIYDDQLGGMEQLQKRGFDLKKLSGFVHAGSFYSNRMLVNYYLGRQKPAERDYKSAVAIDPIDGGIRSDRCEGLAFVGRLEEALADCNAAINNPQFGLVDFSGRKEIIPYGVFVTRGIINVRLGKLDEADADFQQAAEHSNFLPPEAVYGRGIVRRLKGDVITGDTDIERAKDLFPRVAEHFARLGVPGPDVQASVAPAGTNRPRGVIDGDIYVRNARFIEFADHRCLPMEQAANFYFNAAGSYLRAGELGLMGPPVRKGLAIHKLVKEVMGALSYDEARKVTECASDVPDFFARPEPVSCQLVSDYEKLAIDLKRFADRQTRSDVLTRVAAEKLASFDCAKAAKNAPANASNIESIRDCSACPEMNAVPAGQFIMGSPASEPDRNSSEGPQHSVTLAKPFAVGKFDVTFAEWDACVAGGGCQSNKKPNDNDDGRGRHPVIHVSWRDVHEFVDWLSRKTGKSYRLLSEAEWEYAARSGSSRIYPWGDEIGIGNANCGDCGSDFKHTSPVGSYKPNEFGLYDMGGNVVQWVEDTMHANYKGAPADGTAWVDPKISVHVARGSSWLSPSAGVRVARRYPFMADYENGVIGFRVARALDAAEVAAYRPAILPQTQDAPGDKCKLAALDWIRAEELKKLSAYQDYLQRFPNCAFAGLARARIEALQAPARPPMR